MTRHWIRECWGVQFQGSGKVFLISEFWCPRLKRRYRAARVADEDKSDTGQPTRALLFMTRRQARQWCKEKREDSQRTDSCASWRFRPVRVIESVRPIPRRAER